MRVLHVISSISRQGGGPSRSSQGLVAGLRAAGVDAWLMTLSPGEEPWIKGCDQFVNGGSFEDALAKVKPDIVHIHGIWQMELHRCAVICRERNIRYVIAPRGMLEPWSLKAKWFKKRIARFLYQDRDLKKAVALHATAASEAEQFRKLGFKNYVIVSPNGVNVPEKKVGGESRWTKEGSVSDSFDGRAVTSNWYDVVEPAIIGSLKTTRIILSDPALCDRRAVKDVFRSFGLVENAFDGRKVAFPSKSVGKMLGQRGIDLYRVAGSFAELFRSSRRAWSETEAEIENHRVHRNIGAYHQYIAKFNDGKDDCYIRFTVREERGGRLERNEVHSSTVSRITVYKAKGVELSNLGHAQAEDSTPFVDNKIAYFLAGVNQANSTVKLNLKPQPKRALFVSRMHPKKGVLELVESWARVNPDHWQCELVYTLNGDEEKAYEQQVKDRILSLGMSSDFILTGPLNDDAKWSAYARADLFVLPTYSENFGIVVAEALYAGVPVITTKGTPWSDLVTDKCGWWIDLPQSGSSDWSALDSALREATNSQQLTTNNLSTMGENGRNLVVNKYLWSAVVKAVVYGYEQILKG